MLNGLYIHTSQRFISIVNLETKVNYYLKYSVPVLSIVPPTKYLVLNTQPKPAALEYTHHLQSMPFRPPAAPTQRSFPLSTTIMGVFKAIMSCFATNVFVDPPSRGAVPRRFDLADPSGRYARSNAAYTPTNATTTVPRSHYQTNPVDDALWCASWEHCETGRKWKRT